MIIDASRLGRFLADPVHVDAAPIREWLDRRGGTIVYSTAGKFAREVGGRARNKLADYARAGKARLVAPDRLLEDERALAPHISSNDPHVLALARATGVRLLYTGDEDRKEGSRSGMSSSCRICRNRRHRPGRGFL